MRVAARLSAVSDRQRRRRRRNSGQVWPTGRAQEAQLEKEEMSQSSKMVFPGTMRRRMLYGLNSLLLVMTLAQWAVVLASSCRSPGRGLDDCSAHQSAVEVMDTFKEAAVAACGGVLLVPYFVRWLRACSRTSAAVNFLLGPDRCDVKPGEWTIATSRSVFAETLRVVRVAQSLSLLAGAVVTIAGVAVFLGVGIKAFAAETDEGVDSPSSLLCSTDDDLCRFLYHVRGFRCLAAGTLFVLTLMTLVAPLQLWSFAAVKALESSGQQRLNKLKQLPAQVLVGYIWYAALVVINIAYIHNGGHHGRWVMYAYSTGCLLQSLGNIFLIVWTVTLPEWTSNAQKMAARKAISQTSVKLRRSNDSFILRSAAGSFSLEAGLKVPRETQGDVEAPLAQRAVSCDCPRAHGFRFETGLRFQLDIVLLCGLAMWTWREILTVTYLAAHLAIWMLRLGPVAIMLLFCKDPTANFDCLEATDAGFGLLVDANQFKQAIHATVTLGRTYTKKLRMYRGSFLRMQEALAVSYKWQNSALEVASNATINMSRWQLEELCNAISNSNARYVWIDKLSVPQQTHIDIKTKLLTRMMAVYATAGWTVALRSCEPEGDRYHQRGWTLQEFCAAPRLRAVTELELALDISAPSARSLRKTSMPFTDVGSIGYEEETKYAVESSEEEAAIRQRLWCQARAASCMPFWLSDGVSDYDHNARKGMHQKYRVLSAITKTSYEPDHVRALYPLVANCPVEHQEQLLQLVDQICEPLGIKDRKVQALKNHLQGGLLRELDTRRTSLATSAIANKAWQPSATRATSSGPNISKQTVTQ